MRADDLAFLGWLQVVAVLFAIGAAVEWMRASIAYHQHPGRFEERLPAFVSKAATGCGCAAIAITAFCVSQLPGWLHDVL